MCPCIFCICYRNWCQFIVSTVVGKEGKGCSWHVPLYIFPWTCIMNLFRNQMYKFHRIFIIIFSVKTSKSVFCTHNILLVCCHLPPRYFSIPLHCISHGTLPMFNIRSTKYHTTNKCTNCMSFILNHFFKTLFLLLHVSIAYRLSSSGSTYSS